jgi:hypothetical protein
MGLRVAAKVIRNSIRRSVRRFRRAELPSQVETQNIPTISSAVSTNEARTTQPPPPAFSNINEFIRASFSRRNNATSSTEQLVLSEMSIASNEPSANNQV